MRACGRAGVWAFSPGQAHLLTEKRSTFPFNVPLSPFNFPAPLGFSGIQLVGIAVTLFVAVLVGASEKPLEHDRASGEKERAARVKPLA